MKISILLILVLLSGATACSNHDQKNTRPLIAKDTTVANERNNRLLVFVGEKIAATPLTGPELRSDPGILGKYKIIERIYGEYPNDIIEFKSYNHYEIPPFSNFKNALIFLSEDSGSYYEEKYMSVEVFKSRNGHWMAPYEAYDYNHNFNKGLHIQPLPLNFVEPIAYPRKITQPDGTVLLVSYPEPYYQLSADSAIPILGTDVLDLFKLKKNGVLTARQLFGNRKFEVHDIEIEETNK